MPDPVEKLSRRILLKRLAGGAGLALAGSRIGDVLAQSVAPAVVTADKLRPLLPGGVMSGDVTASSAIVWSRTDRPSRMIVDYSTSESFKRFERRVAPAALESSDFTARIDLTDLPPGAEVFYRVRFQDLVNDRAFSEPVTGRFRTAALSADRPVTFVFSGDEAGQGWGINEAWGGYRVYESMRRFAPDFFIHSGDQIYADGPCNPKSSCPTARSGTISSPSPSRTSRRRSTIIAAPSRTTSST
jgi:alkaline phosphatase D